MSYFLLTLLMLVGLFLIAVILLQRGRGGGLAGAFGGLGGQSAFGTRAGDTFTWITVVAVLVWVLLAGLTGRSMYSDSQVFVGRDSDDVDVGPDSKDKAKEKANPASGAASDFEDFPVPPKSDDKSAADGEANPGKEPGTAEEPATESKDSPSEPE